MRRLVGLFAATLMVVASTLVSSSGFAASTQDKTSEHRYIVVLKDGANPRAVASIAGVTPTYVYDAVLNGFAATLNQGQLTALQRHPSVASIEPDQTISVSDLDATALDDQPMNETDSAINSASNVTAYVINTGIATALSEFGGRAINVYDVFGGNGQDCNGVGTYSASVLGGTVYGEAKDVRLRGVRVLDCSGSGTWSGVIAGMNYVANTTTRPAVAHIGFGGGANSSVDTAATNMVNRGITVVVAAGNSNSDACNYSPARAAGVITVGATTTSDTKASYSNYGSCVELYTLGTRTGAWIDGGSRTLSGTGGAAAYVAGCAAKYLGLNPSATPAQVSNWLIANSRLVNGMRILTCPI